MRRLRPLLPPASLLALWAVASATGLLGPRAVPSPAAVARLAAVEARHAALWLDLGATLARFVPAVLAAALLGGAGGLLLGARRPRWRAAEPTVDFLRSIPPILTLPVFLLALGYGEAARAAAVLFGATGIVLLQVGQALALAPPERAETVRLAGLRGLRALAHLHLFEALPSLLTGLRLALTAGLIVAVVSEMLVGAPHGLGSRALEALISYRPDMLWLVILLAGALGMALSGLVSLVERRLVHWAGR